MVLFKMGRNVTTSTSTSGHGLPQETRPGPPRRAPERQGDGPYAKPSSEEVEDKLSFLMDIKDQSQQGPLKVLWES